MRATTAFALMILSTVQAAGVVVVVQGTRSAPAPSLEQGRVVVPMDAPDHLPLVDVTLDGAGPFPFLLDTGASQDGRIDRPLAVRLGLPVAGTAVDGDGSGRNPRIEPRVRVSEIAISGARFPERELIVAPPGRWGPRARGVLGFGLFAGLRLTVDSPRGVVVLERSDDVADLKHAVAVVPYREPRGVPEVEIEIGTRAVSMLLDTGADTGILLPESFLRQLATIGRPVAAAGRTFNNRFAVQSARLAHDLRIGDVVLPSPRASFTDHLPHAILGQRVLSRFAVTFDTHNAVMLLEPSASDRGSR